jgi:hypothetical protein
MRQIIKPGLILITVGILFSACKKDPVQPVETMIMQPHQDTIPLNHFDFFTEYTDDYTGTETIAVWFSIKSLHLPILDDPNITNLKVACSLNNGDYSNLHENSDYYGYTRTGGDLAISLFIFGPRHIKVSVRITMIYH